MGDSYFSKYFLKLFPILTDLLALLSRHSTNHFAGFKDLSDFIIYGH